MSASAPIPALRTGIEAVPVEHEGKRMFVLRDMEGLSQSGLALSPGGLLIASLLDGKRTASDVVAQFTKNTGQVLTSLEITKLADHLEKSGLLETEEVAKKRAKVLQDFIDSPSRKAAHKDRSYPGDVLELSKMLGSYFKDAKGPGKGLAAAPSAPRAPLGLVMPHIDFPRGGPAYAWPFQVLSECPPPDLIVALGVAHMSPNSPWAVTPKEYETPYGAMAVSTELYNDIKGALWYGPRDDEWVHRTEHSLEFAALWLRYLWREKTPPWVPILSSSFERFCPDKAPSTVPTIEGAIKKIGERLLARAKAGQRIMIVAAVDLAHVGPRFGDDLALDAELEKKIEAEDRKSLDLAMKLEADAFYLSAVGDHSWRKVCGLSALYTSLRLIKMLADGEPANGNLLAYGQAPDPQGGIVSFGGAVFGFFLRL